MSLLCKDTALEGHATFVEVLILLAHREAIDKSVKLWASRNVYTTLLPLSLRPASNSLTVDLEQPRTCVYIDFIQKHATLDVFLDVISVIYCSEPGDNPEPTYNATWKEIEVPTMHSVMSLLRVIVQCSTFSPLYCCEERIFSFDMKSGWQFVIATREYYNICFSTRAYQAIYPCVRSWDVYPGEADVPYADYLHKRYLIDFFTSDLLIQRQIYVNFNSLAANPYATQAHIFQLSFCSDCNGPLPRLSFIFKCFALHDCYLKGFHGAECPIYTEFREQSNLWRSNLVRYQHHFATPRVFNQSTGLCAYKDPRALRKKLKALYQTGIGLPFYDMPNTQVQMIDFSFWLKGEE